MQSYIPTEKKPFFHCQSFKTLQYHDYPKLL